jgi:hypothetical protein
MTILLNCRDEDLTISELIQLLRDIAAELEIRYEKEEK